MEDASKIHATCSSARGYYEAGKAEATEHLQRLDLLHARFIWVRMLCFLATAIGLGMGFFVDWHSRILLTVGGLGAVAFLIAIVWHEHVRIEQLKHKSDLRLFTRLLARLDRRWSELNSVKLLEPYNTATFADDLDVAGDASLLTLLSLAGTLPGRRTLQSWIIETPNWTQVRERQRSAKMLIPERELRLNILRTVASSSDGTEDVYGLPKWAASENWLPAHRLAHGLSFLGPGLVLLALLLQVVRWFSGNAIALNVPIALGIAGLVLNVLTTVLWGSWMHDIFQSVTGKHNAVYEFGRVFSSFKNLPQDGGLLDRIRSVSVGSGESAERGFSKLTTLVQLANFQKSPTMYIVYLVLQILFMWDFRVLERLERWKREFGSSVASWFDALGVCEAVVSSSTLADEYPTWAFPQPPSDDRQLLSARGLGHPLLPDSQRVPNDILLENNQPLLLVTGSNMAGKSTFMRAVGLNQLLARAGCSVCADELQTPLYALATSIRVRDSLRDGVSFFMAELKRLKEVVDLARNHARPDCSRILFLLDEILQGTNSQERQIAVATVLDKLLKHGAVGIVSTHDLDLAHAPEIASVSQIVHFREFFETENGKEIMRFDYRMRPGSTPTTNALKLLKLVGLDD